MLLRYLSTLAIVFVALFAGPQSAEAKVHHYLFGTYDDGIYPDAKKLHQKKFHKHAKTVKHKKYKKAKRRLAANMPIKKINVATKVTPTLVVKEAAKPTYQGRQEVQFASKEKPGTIIIKTNERALYEVLGSGKAMRYMVAVGKEGFEWTGVARVGLKKVDPTWTPPSEMIERKPELAKWALGMPGGDPENPLGPRAMYLFKGKYDTGFRIHGTIHPESIGTAASSGCIRMLNAEVIELFQQTRVGTKVIVL